MSSVRKLIVSADDFGMSVGVNAGIVRAHRDGILTNTSLMVNGAAFDEAVGIAHRNPDLGIGLHLVLVQGRAVSPPASIASLVDAGGRFSESPILSGMRYFFQPGLRSELRTEIRAQLEKFADTGLRLSHVDGHLNIHMHPAVLPLLLEVADEFGIRAMRLSREPLRPALRFDRRYAVRKSFEAVAFSALGRFAEVRLREQSIAYPRTMYGLHQTGHVTEAYLLHTIADLPLGLSEIYCHAAEVDDEARRWRPVDYDSAAEIDALISDRVRAAVVARGIELTSYADCWTG